MHSTRPQSAEPAPWSRTPTSILARRWREEGDRAAREQLFERYQPLARKLANRYWHPYEPVDDLIQVASVGLLAAIDRFEPSRGIHFPAYAIPTILGELKRYFRSTGWATHVPRSAQEMALRVDRAVREISVATGRQPSVGELAQYLELCPADVMAGLDACAAHHSVSLNAPVTRTDDGEAPPLIEMMGSDDDGYALVEMTASMADALTRLPYLERRALELRMQHDMKQVDIARELGCSQMQISRLLHRAAERIRHMSAPPAGPCSG